ncbi:MAG: exodeoxyribonuclease VII large subunit [Bacilli bacterium]|nr:exodeoxyribonuclease VII large subunit [Bacilli bacterium]
MTDKYITVTQLTRYIKYKIDTDSNLQEVFLKGEISNFKAHTRGHYYFTIKDENSRINAIMFANQTKKIKFIPTDGMKVLITGKISVYEANGGYQIYVSDMLEDGIGNLYIAYEQLKQKLEKEGLFDPKKKKKIPKIPKRVGVITAPTGAAIRDILSTIKRRFPLTEVILLPSLVQGAEAAPSIIKQIKNAENFNLDTLIIGRGGGSIEDMWCFNDENVAYSIDHCSIPIISAVGHEIDFTIADFVADLRAPTPTGAAELAVPNKLDIINYIEQLSIRSRKRMKNKLDFLYQKLIEIKNKYILKNPLSIYEVKEQQFDYVLEKLRYTMINLYNKKEKKYLNTMSSYIFKEPIKLVDTKKNRYMQLLSKLETLSPLSTIKRGYSIVRKDNKIIAKAKDLEKKDKIEIELMDGKVNVEVI